MGLMSKADNTIRQPFTQWREARSKRGRKVRDVVDGRFNDRRVS